MDVDYPVVPLVDETAVEYSHKPGETDQVGTTVLNRIAEGVAKSIA